MKFRIKRVSEGPEQINISGHDLEAPTPESVCPAPRYPRIATKFRLKRVGEAPEEIEVVGPDLRGTIPGTVHPEPGQPDTFDPAQKAAESLLSEVLTSIGDDPKRWNMVLKDLKRTWKPDGWVPSTARDLLVAWAAANQRLEEARTALAGLNRKGRLTSREQDTKMARKADISFYGRLTKGLRPRAARALTEDVEGTAFLRKRCVPGNQERSQ